MPYSNKSTQFVAASSQYVAFGDVLGFERTDARSFSFWAKWTTGSTMVFMGKMDDTTGNPGFIVLCTNTGAISILLVSNYGGGDYIEVVTSTTGYNDGNWKHICVTYSGSSTAAGLQVYVNGVSSAFTVSHDALVSSMVTTAPLWFGGRNVVASPLYFDGRMDEAAVYNRVLTPIEVLNLYNGGPKPLTTWGPYANLIGWWRMGDGDTYPTLTDRSTGGHDGTMTGMSAGSIVLDAPYNTRPYLDRTNWRFKTNVPYPYSRRSTTFASASSQYVTFGNNFNFERTDSFSISLWVKWTTASTMTFVGKLADSTTFQGWQVSCTSGGKVEFYLVNDWGGLNALAVNTTTSSFNNGAWRHIVVTYDGTSAPGGCRIYIDGTNQALTTVSNTLSATIITSANLWIGGRESASSHQYFNGTMEDVSIWNVVLSASQVTALYNNKAPTNLLAMPTVSSTNLIGWWRMGDGDTAPTIIDWSTGGHNGTMVNSPTFASDWPTTGDHQYDHRSLLRLIKDTLKSTTGWTDSEGAAATLSTPWTVVASSNGTVANTNDNWNVNADLVFNTPGNAHSWIVLRAPALISGQNFEICIDLKSFNTFEISMAASFGPGFDVSAPVTTARPTAPQEHFWWSNQNWCNSSTAFSIQVNTEISDDGYATRIWGYIAGATKFFWMFERPKNTVTGWTNPVIVHPAAQSGPAYTNINDNANTAFRAKDINGWCYMTGEFYVDGCLGQRQTTVNSLTSEWQMTKIGLASITGGLCGYHGEVSDMWWGNVTPATNDTYPASGTLKQFIQVDDIVIPWNRSTPVGT